MSQDENWLDFDPLLKLPNGEKSSHGITNISTKELVYDKHVILGGISLGFITWNTIERISIAELMLWATTTITTTLTADPNKNDASNKTTTWETMQCRLVEARYGCAATTVHDRYMVVVGGRQKSGGLVSSVEILGCCKVHPLPYVGINWDSPLWGRVSMLSVEDGVSHRRTTACCSPSGIGTLTTPIFGFKKATTRTTRTTITIGSSASFSVCVEWR